MVYVLFGTAAGLGSGWNVVWFFGAVALSRVGLYSFDLVGLQVLQISLEPHPRRGRFNAMQASLSAIFDLAKFAIVLVLHRPDQSVALSFLRLVTSLLLIWSCEPAEQVPLDGPDELPVGARGGELATATPPRPRPDERITACPASC